MKTQLSMIHRDSLSCEPILRRTQDGALLCVSQCGDVTEPAPGNRVYAFRSEDEGKTWSAPVSVYPECGKAVYVTEVMALDGNLDAFLTVHSGRFLNMDCVVVRSQDGGKTWTNLGAPPHFSQFCFIRGMIQTRDGKVVIPYQYFPISPEENARLVVASHNIADPLRQKAVWDANIDHIENGVLISEDGGKHYARHTGPNISIKGETGRNWAWTEPTLAELSDGTLAMLLRVCGTGRLWKSLSRDGGKTWSEAQPTDIPNPGNKPKLIDLKDGRIALIHTPNATQGFAGRNPLSIWISGDDMQTWPDQRIISDFPGAFCYPDGFYENGHILFTIEYNRHDILFVDHEL